MTAHLVLVVEDNERNLKLVRDVLCFAGFDVLEARTAEEGMFLPRSGYPISSLWISSFQASTG